MNTRGSTWVGLLLIAGLAGCSGDPVESGPIPVATEIFGELGQPVDYATAEQRASFERGRALAVKHFGPSSGLGPAFNTSFCVSCHEQPDVGGSGPRYRNFVMTASQLPDSSTVLLGRQGIQRQYRIEPPYRVASDDRANLTATRNAIPFFGVGALAEVSESAILDHADPDDRDGDGISGRPNYDRGFIGRFGRKAQTVSLEGFVRGPLFNHVGITSNPLPEPRKNQLPVPSGLGGAGGRRANLEFCPLCQAAAPEEPLVDEDGIADPELTEDQLFDLVSFTMLLAAPEPDPLTEIGKRGRETFGDIGCASCHVPGLEGPRGRVMAYTDLLLHDMGDQLADGIQQGVATGAEFRTQPLWAVVATEPYLHDGRADTLDEAIRMHGGEAEGVRQNYQELPEGRRAALLEFLRSLGGRSRDSDGLMAPDQKPADVGEYGGPAVRLSPTEADSYARGQEVFDRNVSLQAGLGPMFNGDSCRACHFEPTIGGSGPVGVNVTREGIIDRQSGEFFAPDGGTLLTRLTTDVYRRPAGHMDANVVELRQPPPLYGMGRVDQIADADIQRHADPEDTDGDGVSGRVARLDGGRIGRFGWKASFPTLEDFVRDALSNENGLTLPENDAFIAGEVRDDDDVADPEFSGADYRDLVFFSAMLGPPPSKTSLDSTQTVGQDLFGQIGCDGCHIPALATPTGGQVHLYSDLLLHDVAVPGYRGVAEGAAGTREFRTPPLWGIGDSGPYMHDGFSDTLDAAIERHAGEARAAVDRYDSVSDSQRRALISFLETL